MQAYANDMPEQQEVSESNWHERQIIQLVIVQA